MSLEKWRENGWLLPHTTSAQEIKDLLGIVDRDLAQCQIEGLSPDWRFTIAYNAALQAATAALRVSGYRAAGQNHHYRTIDSLTLTIQSNVVTKFQALGKKRHKSTYEVTGAVSDQELREMIKIAQELRRDVEIWLKKSHASLWAATLRLPPEDRENKARG